MNLFSRRIRGFRLIEVIGLGLLIATVLTVYLGKTLAGKERTQIAGVEKQIADERNRVRLLEAEVSYLEQPERLGRLSTNYLGLQPISAQRETTVEALSTLAGVPAPGAAVALAANAASPPAVLPNAPVAAAMADIPETSTPMVAIADRESLKAAAPAPVAKTEKHAQEKLTKGEVTP